MYRSAQAVFMFSQVNHNLMGETACLQFIIAPVKIIYHLSITPTRELGIFTVFFLSFRKKNLTKYIDLSSMFRFACQTETNSAFWEFPFSVIYVDQYIGHIFSD